MTSVFEKLQKIMYDYLSDTDFAKTGKKIKLEDNLQDDLGMDSLDILQVVFNIEDSFGIKVDNEKFDTFFTVNDLLEEIMLQLKNKGSI